MGHLSIEAVAVDVAFGAIPVLTGAGLCVPPGSRLALLGANGSGKTTLLRVLSGALKPQRGRVLLDGVPLSYDKAALTRHRQQVQLVLQDPDDQLFSADVARDVSFGPTNMGLPDAEVRHRVGEALQLLAIEDLAERATHHLSFGQRKRVAIAGAIAMRPCILLLDEPTAGLDPYGVQEMLAALTRLEANGTTVVLSTHDVDLALSWAGEVAIVGEGRVDQGEPHRMLGDAATLRRSRLHAPWVIDLLQRLDLSPPSAPTDVTTTAAVLRPALADPGPPDIAAGTQRHFG